MKLVSAPPTFISATLQLQVEDFQDENRKFGGGCECAIRNIVLSLTMFLV